MLEKQNLKVKPVKGNTGRRATSKHDVDLGLIQAGESKHVAWNQTLKILLYASAFAGGAAPIVKAIEALVHR